MKYTFTAPGVRYTDLASGQVIRQRPGFPAFPVRLASEVFLKCINVAKNTGNDSQYSIYDPCCGGAYMLTVLGFLHADRLSAILGSDIDPDAVQLAKNNLQLLEPRGMETRIREIESFHTTYRKQSHADALESAHRLTALIHNPPATNVFLADALDPHQLRQGLEKHSPDIIFTDIPYGQRSSWLQAGEQDSTLQRLLDSLHPLCHQQSVVAIASCKDDKTQHRLFRRVLKSSAGLRLIQIFQPL